MVRCSVNLCQSRSDRDWQSGVRFYAIPLENKKQCAAAAQWTRRRRELWIAKLNRADLRPEDVKSWMKVCSRHFISGKPAKPTHRNDPDWVPTLRLGDEDGNRTNQDNACSPTTSDKMVQQSQVRLDSTAASVKYEPEDLDSDTEGLDTPKYRMLEHQSFKSDERTDNFGEYFESKEVNMGVRAGLFSEGLSDNYPVRNSVLDDPDMRAFHTVSEGSPIVKTLCCLAAKDYATLCEKYKKLRDYCANLEGDKRVLEASIIETTSILEFLNDKVDQMGSLISSMKKRLSKLTNVTPQQATKKKRKIAVNQ